MNKMKTENMTEQLTLTRDGLRAAIQNYETRRKALKKLKGVAAQAFESSELEPAREAVCAWLIRATIFYRRHLAAIGSAADAVARHWLALDADPTIARRAFLARLDVALEGDELLTLATQFDSK